MQEIASLLCSKRVAEPAAQPNFVQKQLRAQLVELRALVPSAAAALLVQPLLQSSTLQPPQVLPSSDKLPSASQQGLRNSAGAGPTHQAAQQLRQWQAAMALLQQEWPALPALCLASAMDSLLRELPLASLYFAWAVALLRSVALPGQPVTCGAGLQPSPSSKTMYSSADFSWDATSQQLLELLRDCLRSSSASQSTSGSGRTVSAKDAVLHLSSEGKSQLSRNHVLDVMLLLCSLLGEEAAAAAQACISVPARMVWVPTPTTHTTFAVTIAHFRHSHWSFHDFT